MYIFLKKVFVFLSPFIILLVVVELYARNIPSNYTYKNKGLLGSIDSIETLFLGNSHAAYAFNPKEFKNAYNLAQVAQSIYFDKRILVKYLTKLTNLKYVFIPVDFHSFYFSDQNQRNYWSYYAYGIEYKDDLDFWKKNIRLLGYSPRVLIKNIREQYKLDGVNYRAIDVENGVDPNMKLYNGFFCFTNSDSNSFNDSAYTKRANYFNDMVSRSTEYDFVLNDLNELIVLLKAKKITPILITTPCYRPYRKKLNKNILIKNKAAINSIINKFNINYWDYFELDFDSTYFYNCDHLNIKGATMFSRIVSVRLDSLKNNIRIANE